jgi:hypothetical protein
MSFGGFASGLAFSTADRKHSSAPALLLPCTSGGCAMLRGSRIAAYVSYHWHDGKATKHAERFEIYTTLVKEAVLRATRDHSELSVAVAQQGGWQGYQRQFEIELKALEYDDSSGKKYRRLAFALEPARHPGIQLSDFYAGVSRDFILNPDNEPHLAAYRAVESQLVIELSPGLAQEKG